MKSRWVEVQMPKGGKLRIRIRQSCRVSLEPVLRGIPPIDEEAQLMRDLKRIYPTDCHACQDHMCPTADECDVCKMKEKPARTRHPPVNIEEGK